MVSRRGLLLFVAALSMAACQERKDEAAEIAELRAQLAKQEEAITAATKTAVMAWEGISRAYKNQARLDPAVSVTTAVDTNLGRFYVRIAGVQPYLDGQRLTLMVGNPSTLKAVGVNLAVSWGPKAPEPQEGEIAEQIIKTELRMRSKEFSLPSSFPSSDWTPVQIVLPATKAEDVGEVRVKLSFDSFSL